MSPNVPGASTRYVLSVTAGLECPSHTDTALTSIPDCSQWRAQLCRRLWLPGLFHAGSGGKRFQPGVSDSLGDPTWSPSAPKTGTRDHRASPCGLA